MADDLMEFDVSCEQWREYDWNTRRTPYRIEGPQKLFLRRGGTTHRVLDSEGIIHCVPAPGNVGCVLRWKSRDGEPPVKF